MEGWCQFSNERGVRTCTNARSSNKDHRCGSVHDGPNLRGYQTNKKAGKEKRKPREEVVRFVTTDFTIPRREGALEDQRTLFSAISTETVHASLGVPSFSIG